MVLPKFMPNRIYNNDRDYDSRSDNYENIKCDIYEKDNCYFIELDLPGFHKEDVHVDVLENDYLVVKAIQRNDNSHHDRKYLRRERRYGKYQRSFYLGDVDKSRIEANFRDGVLKITMPKKEEKKQKIEIL